jgi:gas vesicle protein
MVSDMLTFFIGMTIGGIVGFVTFCLLSANGRDEDG